MVSVCMIVKNEQDLLPRCLESVKWADEIVIVDTGSTDNTVEIAKSYTPNVYYFEWVDDFSKARNYALSKCTQEWILSIDADEVLNTPCEALRSILSNDNSSKVLGVLMKAEGADSTFRFGRLFRRGVQFEGAIHNSLDHPIDRNVDVQITYGYSPAHTKDPDRALRILTKVVKENPSARERFYLAREYYYREWWKKCIAELKRYLKVAHWLPEMNEARLLMAKSYGELGDYNKACDWAWEAIKYNTNFKEAIEFIADHMDEGNAKRWRDFSKGASNEDVLFVRSGS